MTTEHVTIVTCDVCRLPIDTTKLWFNMVITSSDVDPDLCAVEADLHTSCAKTLCSTINQGLIDHPELQDDTPYPRCAECGQGLAELHMPECGKRAIGHPKVVGSDCEVVAP